MGCLNGSFFHCGGAPASASAGYGHGRWGREHCPEYCAGTLAEGEAQMAQKVTVALEDDLDGGPAEQTVRPDLLDANKSLTGVWRSLGQAGDRRPPNEAAHSR